MVGGKEERLLWWFLEREEGWKMDCVNEWECESWGGGRLGGVC